jgi:hypothetical protein
MANQLPPIPQDQIGENHPWRDWLRNLGNYIQSAQSGGNIWSIAQGGTGSSTAQGARNNLGLGTMAVQNSDNVAITGGTISGVGVRVSVGSDVNSIGGGGDIKIKDIRGPNIYQPGTELSQLNPKDLPSIDIHSNQSNSKQGSYTASYQQQQQNPSSRSYQNQLDQIPRPSNRKDSENGIIPPPPNKMPVNKIQFPSRHSSSSQPSS